MTRYFYLDSAGRPVGPFAVSDLRRLHAAGIVHDDTSVLEEGSGARRRLVDLWVVEIGAATPPPLLGAVAGADPSAGVGASGTGGTPGFARQTSDDLRLLGPHLLMPLRELRSLRWTENRRVMALAVIGLFPLAVIALFAEHGEYRKAFWSVAFYFSALWGVFFYAVFPSPDIQLRTCAIAYFLTGVLSIGVLQWVYRLPPVSWILVGLQSDDLTVRLGANVLGVGLAEETCKAAVVFVLLRRHPSMQPQTSLFYGLIAGLGFGIYEGVNYQWNLNAQLSNGNPAQYYLLNLVRVTTLPFLHAMWAGIAGYFLGFAARFPERGFGLTIVAIGVPATLHGLYNTFSNSVIVLAVALLSVLALNVYLARSVMLRRALESRPA